MMSGLVSRLSSTVIASASSINVDTDIVKVSGSTQVNTINPLIGPNFNGFLVFIPTDGAITLGTSGNILVGITAAQNRAVLLVYDKTVGKWYINSGV